MERFKRAESTARVFFFSSLLLSAPLHLALPSLASVGLTDYSQVDMLGLRTTPANFGAEKCPDSPKWCAQID
jgi:hypothetical protein